MVIIISNNDKNAQSLLNVFSAWCTWADMRIRIDKCSTFGMRKENSCYSNYKPQMFIDGTKIPVVALDSDFVYLGKRFNGDMNKDNAEINLIAKL